ncbi:hypothetical protein ACQ4LE_004520 [Meloidogyne hapla]
MIYIFLILTLGNFAICDSKAHINNYQLNEHTEENDVINEVHKYAIIFSNMAAPMSDWLEHMNYASQKTLDLMRLSGPVGALVAAGVSTVLSPESKEYAALKKLNEDMKRGFNKVEVRLQSIQAKVFEKIDASKYYSHVTSSIVGLESIVDLATNPIYSGHKRIKRNLIGACLSVTGPKGILAQINQLTTKTCQPPTRRMEKLHANGIKLFLSIEKYLNISKGSTKRDYLKYYIPAKNAFVDGKYFLQYAIAMNRLEWLRKEVDHLFVQNRSVSLYEFSSKIREATPRNAEQCILESTLTANEDETHAIHVIAEQITMDITKILHLTVICANASFSTKAEMEEFKNTTRLSAVEIFKFMSNWIAKKLEFQWPSIQMEYALNAIGDDEVEIPEYNKTAEIIANELIKRGHPKKYQTLNLKTKKTTPKPLNQECNYQ